MLFRVSVFMMSLAVLLLQGCATVKPASLPRNFWKDSSRRVSVVVMPLPKPTASRIGAQGLLDMAINAAVTSDWDKYVESMQFEPYPELAEKLVNGLIHRGFDASATSLDLAALPDFKARPGQKFPFEKDLSGVSALADADYLLLVDVRAFGTARGYYGFIPTSDPSGYVSGYITLVDMNTNDILWWKDISVSKTTEQPWDQPPAYPNLSRAIDEAVESSKDEFVAALFASDAAAPATAVAK